MQGGEMLASGFNFSLRIDRGADELLFITASG
jgi:hypothetical protein